MKTETVEITVTGPTGSGKSAVLATIRDALEAKGLAVTFACMSMRKNPPLPLGEAELCEHPRLDQSVFVLYEENEPRPKEGQR